MRLPARACSLRMRRRPRARAFPRSLSLVSSTKACVGADAFVRPRSEAALGFDSTHEHFPRHRQSSLRALRATPDECVRGYMFSSQLWADFCLECRFHSRPGRIPFDRTLLPSQRNLTTIRSEFLGRIRTVRVWADGAMVWHGACRGVGWGWNSASDRAMGMVVPGAAQGRRASRDYQRELAACERDREREPSHVVCLSSPVPSLCRGGRIRPPAERSGAGF